MSRKDNDLHETAKNARDWARMQVEGMRNVAGPYHGHTVNAGLAAVMTEDQKKRRQARLDETRQLKGHFLDYCTEDIDVSSPCEVFPPEYQQNLDCPKWYEGQDRDRAWIEKTEKELF